MLDIWTDTVHTNFHVNSTHHMLGIWTDTVHTNFHVNSTHHMFGSGQIQFTPTFISSGNDQKRVLCCQEMPRGNVTFREKAQVNVS